MSKTAAELNHAPHDADEVILSPKAIARACSINGRNASKRDIKQDQKYTECE